MIGFYIYLMMIADSVRSAFGWMAFIFAMLAIISVMFLVSVAEEHYNNKHIKEDIKEDEDIKQIFSYIKKFFVLFLACIMLYTVTPTSKGVAAIIGGSVTYDILTSEAAKEIGGKGLELLNKQIDEMLKD